MKKRAAARGFLPEEALVENQEPCMTVKPQPYFSSLPVNNSFVFLAE